MWNWLRANPLLQQLQSEQSWLYLNHEPGMRVQIEQINGQQTRPLPYIVGAANDTMRVYPLRKNMPAFVFTPDDIRWFGRPKKYTSGLNDMWLHVEKKEGWFIVKLQMSKTRMVEWVRVMKQLTPDDLITAYRRRRPYVHYGAVEVCPAQQDIYGAWTLDAPLTFYLMPLYVVLLNGARVVRLIPLQDIQMIRAGARLDAPDADGLVQFMVQDEKLAFSVWDYQPLAAALGEAAKRSLEEPIMQKAKPKDVF